MSLLPLMMREMMEGVTRMRDPFALQRQMMRYLDAEFPSLLRNSVAFRPWGEVKFVDCNQAELTDKEFKINIDVQEFKPEELKVKIAEDGFMIIEGKHESKPDEHGFISRQFVRKFKLPTNIVMKDLTSKLSTDGVLTLHAPFKEIIEEKFKEIPITHVEESSGKK